MGQNLNSFTAWIGGKKLLRKAIIARFPPEFDRYIEVFGGAGWVFFGKEKLSNQLEVFNDFDSNLINLYRCIKYHCDELQRELDWLLISREQFKFAKQELSNENLTDIQRAARYFHVIKASFGADRRSFGCTKRNLASAIEYLREVQSRLEGVVIENKDFENLVKVYGRPNALFYLDPPYFGTEKYYDNAFTLADHQRLQQCLSNLKGKFILSYNDCEFVRNLYSNFNIEAISRNSNLTEKSNSKDFNEVIIRNY